MLHNISEFRVSCLTLIALLTLLLFLYVASFKVFQIKFSQPDDCLDLSCKARINQ